MTRLLVTGDREWPDNRYKATKETILDFEPGVIIHGAARGADLMAEAIAKEAEIDYVGIPAKWKQHGKKAGPIRNGKMLDKFHPDVVLAFHADLENSKGTLDMVKRALQKKTNRPKVFWYDGVAAYEVRNLEHLEEMFGLRRELGEALR